MSDSSQEATSWKAPYRHTPCEHSFFFSHVREDLEDVRQLKQLVDRRKRSSVPALPSFLDFDDWPHGKPTAPAIREKLCHSEFLVVWVTPHYLSSNRGWIWFELAYGQLIEQSLNLGRSDWVFPYVFVIFRNVVVEEIAQSPLLEYWNRSLVPAHEPLVLTEIAERLVKARVSYLADRR
jgi:hypothetical protein